MLNPDQQQELLDGVVEDFTARLRMGEKPAISDYTSKYPSLAMDIEELLTSVAMIEELKTQTNSIAGSLKREMKEITALQRIGDYRIVRELGRGGMGVVFEAVHESLGRRVAIKVMPNRKFDDEKYLERFKREAQAAANLHHTNIVSVFGIGQIDDHHYYVMEFVDGETLSQILADLDQSVRSNTEDGRLNDTVSAHHPVDVETGVCESDEELDLIPHRRHFNTLRERFQWAARLGLQVADGLSYAHQLGLLHRDVKPSNILVDKYETAWLTDFGLVKNISNKSITKTGDIIGTPQYMAPESFEGKYDERSETYCLGLTLYELVTCQPAFENASTPELIRRITSTTPIAPRKLNQRIPRDLNRIILKAISREPRYRYQKASSIRDDLRAFLENRPISARKVSMTENIYRWSCRNPFAAALSLLTALMICAIAIGATIALRFTSEALIVAQEQKTAADVEKRIAGYNKEEAEKMLRLVVASYDELFRSIVLKNSSEQNGDVTLDGFDDLAGLASTVTEEDANALEQMLQFYVGFAETNKEYARLNELTAKSHRRVANIYHLTGNFEKAIDAYEKSIETYSEIHKLAFNNIEVVLALTKTINEKGRAYELEGSARSKNKAKAEYQRAVEILKSYPEYNKKDRPFIILNQESDLYRLYLQLCKTLVLYASPEINFRPGLPDRFKEIAEVSSLNSIANRYLNEKRSVKINVINSSNSLLAINEAISIAEKMIKPSADNKKISLVQANAWSRLGAIQLAKRRYRDSFRSLGKSESILKELMETNPDDSEIQFALAQKMAVPRRSGSPQSIRSLSSAKELLISLTENHPQNLDYSLLLAHVQWRLGSDLERTGEIALAKENLIAANSIYQDIAPKVPRSRKIQANSIGCLFQTIDLLAEQQEFEMAIDILKSSLDQLGNSSTADIPKFYLNRLKIYLYHALAIVEKESGDFGAAMSAKKQAVTLWLQGQDRAPRNRRFPGRIQAFRNSTIAPD